MSRLKSKKINLLIANCPSRFETDLKLPPGVRYAYVGQAGNFQELMANMALPAALGVLFIYLVIASLYESFVDVMAPSDEGRAKKRAAEMRTPS